ncbi:HprK-related kinase B [Gilvimarinus agarilyticus]|uniref:HprK-related kinase B n=1 Tax=Gilvimarinus agarilyticus TaxID=679259 RepID=UPI000696198C|nr:HprK-related kinase B [Gilvimarinus agarilyticus]
MAEAKHQPDTAAHDTVGWLEQIAATARHGLTLALPGATIAIECSQISTANALSEYFSPWICVRPDDIDITVSVIEHDAIGEHLPWQDWTREPGKSGRKDTYIDVADARLIRKYRTGMVFLQSRAQCIAIGPCNANLNQIVNFINNQAMNALQQSGWLIGHAAAACYQQQAIAIAGFSGGGKSTSMLRLLEHPEVNFISNDRVFIKDQNGQLMLSGVAKMPRVNPGTLLNNARLLPLLSASQRQHYLTLAPDALWELEEKYDVMIPPLYGNDKNNRIDNSARLSAVMLLNWDRHSESKTSLEQVDITQRQDLLPALMKTSGPFYQDKNGQFQPDTQPPQPPAYNRLLSKTRVFEVSGGVDFNALQDFCWKLWALPEAHN